MNSTNTTGAVVNNIDEIKKLVCKISGVLQCGIVSGKANSIEEIHVLANNERNIKQLVRDIQSAIASKFEIFIDYKIISIAQIDEIEIKETRLKIGGISVNNIENTIEAVVSLVNGDRVFEGKSNKVKSRNNRCRAVAEATLLAVEKYLDLKDVLYVEAIEKIIIAGREVFLCVAVYSWGNKEEILTGSCFISNDEDEATLKAVLAALNRKINIIS